MLLLFLAMSRNFFLSLISFGILFGSDARAQQPNPSSNIHPQGMPGVYLLSITPKNGGKSYTLFHKSKVGITLSDGREVKGKVRGVSRDSISIDYKSYEISSIRELRYNQGSALGIAAAGAMLVGVGAIALAGQGDSRNDAVFWTGVGLAVAGAVTLIPLRLIKKKFSSTDYDFTPVLVGSY